MGSGDKTMMEKAHMGRFSESVTLARITKEVSRMIRLQGVLATLAALPLHTGCVTASRLRAPFVRLPVVRRRACGVRSLRRGTRRSRIAM
jgi:hypothetical protein